MLKVCGLQTHGPLNNLLLHLASWHSVVTASCGKMLPLSIALSILNVVAIPITPFFGNLQVTMQFIYMMNDVNVIGQIMGDVVT